MFDEVEIWLVTSSFFLFGKNQYFSDFMFFVEVTVVRLRGFVVSFCEAEATYL